MATIVVHKPMQATPLIVRRIGEFFEASGPDAATLATLCGLPQTFRDGMPLSGFPAHNFADYAQYLAGRGYVLRS